MSAPERIRLCTVVFSATVFRDKLKFWPAAENIDHECEKKKVYASLSVKTETNDSFQTENFVRFTYDEWMFGCKVKINSDESLTYYISRGLHASTVIVFQYYGQNIYSAYIGLSEVGLILGPGEIKPIKLLDDTQSISPTSPLLTHY